MQTFESGGVLAVNANRQMRALTMAVACGAAAATLPPLIAVYLLIVA